MPKAYSYLRFSSAKQELGDSVRRQTEAADKYVRENPALNLVLADDQRFSDLGRSAYRGDAQDALKEFLKRVREGYIEEGSYLLVENFDRLSRQSVYDAQPTFRTLIDAGIVIVTLQDNQRFERETLNKPEGIFLLMQSMMSMYRANNESVRKSGLMKAIWKRKRDLAAEKNKRLTKKVPFWLTPSRKIKPDKAEIVKRIFSLAGQGFGEASIACQLNAEGIPAAKGGRWSTSSLAKLLRSPTVVGTLYGSDRVHIRDGYYPEIIDNKTWLLAQRYVDTSGSSRKREGREPRPLAGLMVCRCGKSLVSSTRTGRIKKDGTRNSWHYLVCSDAKVGAGDCQFVGIPYDKATRAVLGALQGVSDALETGDGSEAVERAQAVHRQALEGAEEAYQTWMETKGKFAKEKLRQAEEALDSAKQNLASVIRQSGEVGYRVTLDALQRVNEGEVSNSVLKRIVKKATIDVLNNQILIESHGGVFVTSKFDDEQVEVVDTVG